MLLNMSIAYLYNMVSTGIHIFMRSAALTISCIEFIVQRDVMVLLLCSTALKRLR